MSSNSECRSDVLVALSSSGNVPCLCSMCYWGVAFFLLCGCAVPQEAAVFPPQLNDKLERIDPISFEELSKSEPMTVEQASTNAAQKVIVSAESTAVRTLSLEDVRSAALASNLGLV
ncbi:MAG: hypothetical protein JXR40_13590 [Pontiellaceae bacterium]|nr:hypothetical protein [Pontiellaceae bacterium]